VTKTSVNKKIRESQFKARLKEIPIFGIHLNENTISPLFFNEDNRRMGMINAKPSLIIPIMAAWLLVAFCHTSRIRTPKIGIRVIPGSKMSLWI